MKYALKDSIFTQKSYVNEWLSILHIFIFFIEILNFSWNPAFQNFEGNSSIQAMIFYENKLELSLTLEKLSIR